MAKRENKDAVIEMLIVMLRQNGAVGFEIVDKIHDLQMDEYISSHYASHLISLTEDEY
ncbi:hypothetical protein [Paenibacillus sp. O199]|uniref:hypothetical protein n=1 Tax=Paenibacillus sp. O199 TaxID=1643925 RepID=UPI0013747B8B|nr:hypothetical protein [Paenibacillus sp. O199]